MNINKPKLFYKSISLTIVFIFLVTQTSLAYSPTCPACPAVTAAYGGIFATNSREQGIGSTGTIVGAGISGVMAAQKDAAGNIIKDAAGNAIMKPVYGLKAMGEALKTQILPTLAGEFAFYGVTKGLEAAGVDSRISQLAGIPIRASLSTITRGIANNGNFTDTNNKPVSWTTAVLDSVAKGALEGITSVGISYAGEAAGLQPWQTALIGRTITSGIAGIKDGNILGGLKNSIVNTLTLGGTDGSAWGNAVYLSKIQDFSKITQEQGIAAALETYATSIFQRDSVEYIVNKFGSVLNAITSNSSGGQEEVNLDLSDKNKDLKIAYKDGILTTDEGNVRKEMQLGIGPDGRLIALNGSISTTDKTGRQTTYYITDGKQDWISVNDSVNNYSLGAIDDNDSITYFANGSLKDYTLVDNNNGTIYSFNNGKLASSTIPLLQLSLDENNTVNYLNFSDPYSSSIEARFNDDGSFSSSQIRLSLPSAESRITEQDKEAANQIIDKLRQTSIPNDPIDFDNFFKNSSQGVPGAAWQTLHNQLFGISGGAAIMTPQGPVYLAMAGAPVASLILANKNTESKLNGIEGEKGPDGNWPKAGFLDKLKDFFRKGYRYVTEEEMKLIKKTGKIPNTDIIGDLKDVHITLDKYSSGMRAKDKLQLDKIPKYRIEFKMNNVKDRTIFTSVIGNPKNGSGKGTESITKFEIEITSIVPIGD